MGSALEARGIKVEHLVFLPWPKANLVPWLIELVGIRWLSCFSGGTEEAIRKQAGASRWPKAAKTLNELFFEVRVRCTRMQVRSPEAGLYE